MRTATEKAVRQAEERARREARREAKKVAQETGRSEAERRREDERRREEAERLREEEEQIREAAEAERRRREAEEQERRRREQAERARLPAEASAIQRRREAQNGQTGYLTITLSWDTPCDLDLHCTTPDGGKISYEHPVHGGGKLDIDANASQRMDQPIENIFFASRPAPGSYKLEVNNYASRIGTGDTAFTLLVEIGGASHRFQSAVAGNRTVLVATVQVPASAEAAPTVAVGRGPPLIKVLDGGS